MCAWETLTEFLVKVHVIPVPVCAWETLIGVRFSDDQGPVPMCAWETRVVFTLPWLVLTCPHVCMGDPREGKNPLEKGPVPMCAWETLFPEGRSD